MNPLIEEKLTMLPPPERFMWSTAACVTKEVPAMLTEQMRWNSSSEASTPLKRNKAALLMRTEQRPSRCEIWLNTDVKSPDFVMSACQELAPIACARLCSSDFASRIATRQPSSTSRLAVA